MTNLDDIKPTLSFGGEPAPPDPAIEFPSSGREDGSLFAEESALSEEERRQMEEFAEQIDLKNTRAIMEYGAGTQRKLADFSEKTLESVRTKDMGDTGRLITNLVVELKNFDAGEDEKGFRGFFKKKESQLAALRTKYNKVETNVNSITKVLENHERQLLKDIDLLDRMYALNLNYFKELSMYILAGKKALERARATELAELQRKAAETGMPEDAQEAKDFASMCDRFEKKIYDLELTRTVSMQTAPQIRLVQNADTVMAEKIQSTIVNTIPLWKNQMVIAMGIEHSNQAAQAQRQVTDMTNELLKKNAKALKTAAVESAREAERGIVDIETLRETNETLISTLDSVMQIQQEGREKRQAAETELVKIEDELKNKLLQLAR